MGKKKQKKQLQKKAEKKLVDKKQSEKKQSGKKQAGKKQGEKKPSTKEKGKKKLDALKEERRLLQAQVAELQQQLDQAYANPPVSEAPSGLPELDDPFKKGDGPQSKIDWERYSFLHDRYEAYVEEGIDTAQAGKLANEDLMKKFGKKAGYTDEQLECIFL
mgnify:CR=1 FL=1